MLATIPEEIGSALCNGKESNMVVMTRECLYMVKNLHFQEKIL